MLNLTKYAKRITYALFERETEALKILFDSFGGLKNIKVKN